MPCSGWNSLDLRAAEIDKSTVVLRSTDVPKSTVALRSTDVPKSTIVLRSTDVPKNTIALRSTYVPLRVSFYYLKRSSLRPVEPQRCIRIYIKLMALGVRCNLGAT
jgi:hypothetical protein